MVDPLPLRGLSGRGVRVAIVDSGIDPTHPDVGAVASGVGIADDGGVLRESTTSLDTYGHGTACAALVRRLAPEAILVPIKVGDSPEALSPRAVAAGIARAVALDVDVVNVAAGVIGNLGAREVTDALEQARDRRIVVVAAESNGGETALPASSPLAIAVSGGVRSMQSHAIEIGPEGPRHVRAYGGHQRLAWVQPRHVFVAGNSFAAPRVAALVALIIEARGRLPLEELLAQLARVAAGASGLTGASSGSTAKPKTDDSRAVAVPAPAAGIGHIQRAALYPFTKELHGLVRFADQIPFRVTGIGDAVTSGRVGKDAGVLLGDAPSGLRVTSRLEHALADADTLILGYLRAHGKLLGRDLGLELARQAVTSGKHVYAFEPFDRPEHAGLLEEARARGLTVSWPRVGAEELRGLREAPRGDASKIPIVGVFGTGPSQGKVTLQMALSRGLAARGYRTAMIGTEHQSLLLGMDACFPIGHVNNVSLPLDLWREWFALQYATLARSKSPEVFVVGSQSGVVPFTLDVREPGTLTLRTVLTLMATRPDTCVLVVNLHDQPAFITQHIDALRIFGKAHTAVLAAAPSIRRVGPSGGIVTDALSAEEAHERRAALADALGRPVLDTLDAEGIARAVIAALA